MDTFGKIHTVPFSLLEIDNKPRSTDLRLFTNTADYE
jgi:hypothetical protein